MKISLYASQSACRVLTDWQSETHLSCILERRDRRDAADANPNLPNDFGKS